VSIFSALDLPPELHDLQDLYWKRKREWEALERSLEKVALEILSDLDGGDVVSPEEKP
jgi:hypothetical protein